MTLTWTGRPMTIWGRPLYPSTSPVTSMSLLSKVEGTGERGQDFDRDQGLEISLGGDIGQPENWFLPWNVATSVVCGNRIR